MAFSIAEASAGLHAFAAVKALASNGSTVVGVGQDGLAHRSTDGGASFVYADMTFGNWVDLKYGGGRFVAVDSTANQVAWSSDDGVTFNIVSLSSGPMLALAHGAGKFVACNGSIMRYSTDGGETWALVTAPEAWDLRATSLMWNGTQFMAHDFNGTKSYLSSDGITWSINTTVGLGQRLYRTVWDGTNYIGLRYNSTQAYVSADGINWTMHTLPVSRSWTHIVSNGTRLFATAGGQSTNSYVMSTDGGTTWEAGTFSGTSIWQSLTTSGVDIISVASNATRALGTGDVALETVFGDITIEVTADVNMEGAANAFDIHGDIVFEVPVEIEMLGGAYTTTIGGIDFMVPPTVAMQGSFLVSGDIAFSVSPVIACYGEAAVAGDIAIEITADVQITGGTAVYGTIAMSMAPNFEAEATHYAPIVCEPAFEAAGVHGAAGDMALNILPSVAISATAGFFGDINCLIKPTVAIAGNRGVAGAISINVQALVSMVGTAKKAAYGNLDMRIDPVVGMAGSVHAAYRGDIAIQIGLLFEAVGFTPVLEVADVFVVRQQEMQITVAA